MEEFPEGAEGNLPTELLMFFGGAPRVLLIKGKPRVGKTLLALGMAEALGPPMNSYIINTRELEPRNYEAFPWLRTNEQRDKALDCMPSSAADRPPEAQASPPQALGPSRSSDTEAKLKSAHDLLKSILGEEGAPAPPPERRQSPASVKAVPAEGPPAGASGQSSLDKALGNKNVRELTRVSRGMEAAGSAKSVVVVNRVDRLGEKYDIPLRPLVLAMKNDFVTGRWAHLLLVLEKPSQQIDDIVDGTIILKDMSHGEEFLGQLEIGKLMDLPLKRSKWMYNLRTGKLQILKGIQTV